MQTTTHVTTPSPRAVPPGADRSAGPSGPTQRVDPTEGPNAARRHRPAPIAVYVASSEHIERAGVSAMLSRHPRLRVVDDDEADRARVIVRVARHLGAHDLQRLREPRPVAGGEHGEPAVLMVTDGFADDFLLAALDAGVAGVLRRDEVSRGRLVSSVLAVADGAVLLPPRLQGLLVQQLRRVRAEVLDPNGLTLSGLTARERDVLRLVAEGLDTDQIAARLTFSPRTVKYVLTHVMTRYGLRSRTHAVAFAVRSGAI